MLYFPVKAISDFFLFTSSTEVHLYAVFFSASTVLCSHSLQNWQQYQHRNAAGSALGDAQSGAGQRLCSSAALRPEAWPVGGRPAQTQSCQHGCRAGGELLFPCPSTSQQSQWWSPYAGPGAARAGVAGVWPQEEGRGWNLGLFVMALNLSSAPSWYLCSWKAISASLLHHWSCCPFFNIPLNKPSVPFSSPVDNLSGSSSSTLLLLWEHRV